MQHDYRKYVGVPYESPTGCFDLVARVMADRWGQDISGIEIDVRRLHALLLEHGTPVDSPVEGDVALIRHRPWHIGIMVDERHVLHTYLGGSSCIEDLRSPHWSSRVAGFYRYEP